jgi:hypothetical protein
VPPSLACSAVRLSLPSSLVLASVIIALGLYFGLRTQAPSAGSTTSRTGTATELPASPVDPSRTGAVPPLVQGSSQGGSTLPPRPVPPDDQLLAEVVALVERAKPRWKAACWDTADPATRKPGRYVSGLAFDASGKLTISGVSEIRDGSDPGVSSCLRLLVNEFQISAPGRNTTYEIPFEIP